MNDSNEKPVSSDASQPGQGPEATCSGGVERIERNDAGQLLVKLAGRAEPIVDAKVARCFPWSVPESYVSIRDADGKEIVMLKSLEELDADSRDLVEGELRDKVFNPKILQIIDYKDEFGVTSITADTDRGEVTFQIRSRDDVRVLSPTRALFRDVDGNTYELTDVTALNAAAQKHLQRYF